MRKGLVVINHKTTKFESNSQLTPTSWVLFPYCYQSQNYEIWKQFTTENAPLTFSQMLLSIAKLQNLKAIHNRCLVPCCVSVVVINHKTTKFESNSQQTCSEGVFLACCYQSQNYKIWKQFTTCWNLTPDPSTLKVVINHKTTKFESNSQHKCLIYQIVQQ